MMRILLTLLAFVCVFYSSAQERQIRKSQRLYDKGKYEKCILKTKKYLKKYRKNADLQLFIVKSNLALYDEEKNSRKIYQLKRILRSHEKLMRYTNNGKEFLNLDESIKECIFLEIKNTNLSQRNLDYLHIQLAENFEDTTFYFRKKYLRKIEQSFAQEKQETVIDSILELDSLRSILLKSGLKQIGVSYKYGGTDSTGFDCSGFTQYVYKNIGIQLPHNAQLQSELGEAIDLEEAQTGDLIFFGERRAAHAAMIYINKNGEPELIHCVSRGVSHDTDDDNNHIYWMHRPYRIKRFLDYQIPAKNE